MNAKQSLSSISENQDLWVAQYRQEIMERDYNSGMSAAENRGLERGRSEAKLPLSADDTTQNNYS